MRVAGVLLIAVLAFACSVCLAAFPAQPETVPGETDPSTERGADALAPAEALHTTDPKARWRIYDGGFPSLAQLAEMPDDPMPIYGLYTSAGLYREFREDIKAVGFTSFRVGHAGDASPEADAGLRAMIEDGAFIMIVLGATRRDEFDSDEAYIANALASFRKTIERYGPDGSFFKDNPDVPYRPVSCFQVLNEPNFQYMYRGSNDAAMIPIRHKLYAQLLPRTYAMIKERWPSVTVVGWTCGGAAAQDLFFVTNALKFNPAMVECFDVFSTHPYVAPAPPEAFAIRSWGGYAMPDMLSKIRRQFAQAGRPPGRLPVWYTEGGWRLRQEDGGMHAGGELPPDLHAAYYVRYYAIGLRLGVGRIMPMYTVDADGFNGGIFNRTTAWQRDDANPFRPAAHAIQTMIRLMPNPKLKRIISDGDGGYFAYEFVSDKRDPGSGTTVMAWTVTGGGRSVRLPVSYTRAVVTHILGARKAENVVGGAVPAEVGPCPIYVTQALE